MLTPILATKLYIPPSRAKVVPRPLLIEQLNAGLHRKLTLISASAGFGKSTLASEWIAACNLSAAWLSLDEHDHLLPRFLTYFVAALQTVAPNLGQGILLTLQSPQPPPMDVILTTLLNEISALPNKILLVLDDYHTLDSPRVDQAVTFLLEHLPPTLHLVIATREDPQLPLARLRAHDQVTEIRVKELRFTLDEAQGFLNHIMGLALSAEEIAALESRTEGWVAGLQLAAISMQKRSNTAEFINSFTGSHYFVLDYLVEEVLQQQPESIQNFLLYTSILDRFCAPLCDALLDDTNASSQARLGILERANLFIMPLDDERHWYRYHHLFADLLRHRLQQKITQAKGDTPSPTLLHQRASDWLAANGLDAEAFQHAVAANDIERAAMLVEGKEMPLHFRGAVLPVAKWLATLPADELDDRPALWVIYASVLLFLSNMTEVESKLHAAEVALRQKGIDDHTHDPDMRDLIGHIASIRATAAVSQHHADEIVAQSRRALVYLHPNNLAVRTATTWTLGYAYQLQGERAAAGRAYRDAINSSQAIGHYIILLTATIGLASIQEADNQLRLAAETNQQALEMAGDPPPSIVCEAHLGLARIFYEWNDFENAQSHAQQSFVLAQQILNTDRAIATQIMRARLLFAQGEVAQAKAQVSAAEAEARQQNFLRQIPPIAAMQIHFLLQEGKLAEALQLAQLHNLPIQQARVHIALGESIAALTLLDPLYAHFAAKQWESERLQVIMLQALATHIQGDQDAAITRLTEALAITAAEGFLRSYVDEGPVMAQLLSLAKAQGIYPQYSQYIDKILALFSADQFSPAATATSSNQLATHPALIEPLSPREIEVLQLIAQGLSNQEISEKLFLALSTVKGHNRNIFDKLQVHRRTEAILRARVLGIL